MVPDASPFDALHPWHDFFALTGSASATLMGLVFVSVSMVLGMPQIPAKAERDLFATPVVMKFAYALIVAAASLAPWTSARAYGITIASLGVLATAQSSFLLYGMFRRHRDSSPINGGAWMWTGVAPLAAALFLTVGGCLATQRSLHGIEAVACAVIVLDVVGISNSWQLLLWILSQRK